MSGRPRLHQEGESQLDDEPARRLIVTATRFDIAHPQLVGHVGGIAPDFVAEPREVLGGVQNANGRAGLLHRLHRLLGIVVRASPEPKKKRSDQKCLEVAEAGRPKTSKGE